MFHMFPRKFSPRKGRAIWQIFFCLTLLSFLCRSVIPMGYMPDLSGGRGGTFAVTLCTMAGDTDLLRIDVPDHSGKSSSDDGIGGQDCPFGMVVSQALIPAQTTPVLSGTLLRRPVPLSHDDTALPPLPALGPPLGSRAPPSNLG